MWDLRVEALDRKLTRDEFLRVLTHLAKHRGFKSYRKSEEAKSKDGKVLQAIKVNEAALSERGHRTLAELIVKNNPNGKKRNGDGVYTNSIPRTEIERETDMIFAAQKESL